MDQRQRPTLRDVAREAGLSVTQVSRALNGHSDVATATRRRAENAAAELGYVPNLEARRLKSPKLRSNSVGLILPNQSLRFSDPFFGDLLTAMVSEAAADGLELQLSTTRPDADPIRAYDLAIRRKRVDGFVVVRTEVDDPRVRFLQQQSFPFVVFGRLPGQNGFAVVDSVDDAIQPGVDHLVQLGHRRIACIAEPSQFSIGAFRLRSFRRAVAAHGMKVSPEDVVEAGFHEESGYEGALQLLKRNNPPTAIVAQNDLVAFGVLRGAADSGVSVPEDLSVIGFDDVDAARMISPALTTLRQPAGRIGALLIRQLLPSIAAGTIVPGETLVTPELVIRASTAPPA